MGGWMAGGQVTKSVVVLLSDLGEWFVELRVQVAGDDDHV